MMFARADSPDEIAQLLERARLLSEAQTARQVIRNGGMMFFDTDADLARRYREASIWAGNQPGGRYEDAIDAALFMADMLDPSDATEEEMSLADDYLFDDVDDTLPF